MACSINPTLRDAPIAPAIKPQSIHVISFTPVAVSNLLASCFTLGVDRFFGTAPHPAVILSTLA